MSGHQLPEEFERRLEQIWPNRPQGAFCPKAWQTFRINTLKIGIGEAHRLLAERGIGFKTVSYCPYAIVVEKVTAKSILDSDLAADGRLYSQGMESMLAVIALDPKPGDHVLDLCAAPGSKTSQIAMLMNNQGLLMANEPIRQRLYRLKAVLQLTGAQARISSVDGRRFKPAEEFDRILVDAPCSSEGRFLTAEPKTFAYWSVRKIKEMSHKQKGLLFNAARLLKPGGTMVYATCTFAPEENEEVVDWFLRKTGGRFELTPFLIEGVASNPGLLQWQSKSYDKNIKAAARLLPNETMEGFFIAKFRNCHYK